MKPELDATLAPICVVRWGPDLTLAELDAHFEEMIAFTLAAPAPIGVVMDMSQSGRSAALQRERGSHGLKRAYRTIGHKVVAVAHVIPEPLARSMMTILYWLMPPPFPTEMVDSVDAGVQWTRARLAARGYLPRVEAEPRRAGANERR